jgi:hypothetical protein
VNGKKDLGTLEFIHPRGGIELGWVTRGTRPKKPSSSRGFACKARRAWGSWGLKTENRKPKYVPDGGQTGAGRGVRWGAQQWHDKGQTECHMGGRTRGRMGARRDAKWGPDGMPDGGQMGCPTGARRGGGRKDYLLLKEKTTCYVYVSFKSSLASDVSDAGWM